MAALNETPNALRENGLRFRIPLDAALSLIAWSPARDMLGALTSEGSVRIWDTADAACPQVVIHSDRQDTGPFQGFAWLPSGRHFAVGGSVDSISVCDVESGQMHKVAWARAANRIGRVYSIASAPTANTLACLLVPGLLIVWDLTTAQIEGMPTLTFLVPSTTPAPYPWAGNAPGSHLILDHATGPDLLWSPLGDRFVVGSGPRVDLWKDGEQTGIYFFQGEHIGDISGMAWSPDGRTLAVGNASGGIALCNMDELRREAILPTEGAPRSLSFCAAGSFLAAIVEGRLSLWRTDTASLMLTPEVPATRDDLFTAVAFHPSKPVLAAADNTGLRIWEYEPAGIVAAVDREGSMTVETEGAIAMAENRTNTPPRSEWTPALKMEAAKEIIAGLVGLLIVGTTASVAIRSFGFAGQGQTMSDAKDVLTLMIGLVGAVLGYYFGRLPSDARAAQAQQQATAAQASAQAMGAAVHQMSKEINDMAMTMAMTGDAVTVSDVRDMAQDLQEMAGSLSDMAGPR